MEAQRQARSPKQNQAEAEFIEDLLDLEESSKLLDVPCGNGRLSLELASRGHRVTGVDMTKHLLEEASRMSADRGLEIKWENREMRDLPWDDEFDGAFCMWGSFGYFDDEGNAEFLKAVSGCIKKGANFVLDVHAAEGLMPKFERRGWQWMGDVLLVEDRSYDVNTGRVEEEWLLIRDGVLEEKHSSIRVYTYREIRRMLERAGFEDIQGYGSLEKEPFQLGSKRLYLVSRKA